VTGIDIAENSILAARGRARADQLDVRFDEGDAEALPYADASYDVVPPGRYPGHGQRTKTGFIGQMLAVVSKFVSPPGMPSPLLWADPDRTIVSAEYLEVIGKRA
jgi:hypothetical protein